MVHSFTVLDSGSVGSVGSVGSQGVQFVASGRKFLSFGAGELRLCVLNLVCFLGDVMASLFTQGGVLKLHSHQSAVVMVLLHVQAHSVHF